MLPWDGVLWSVVLVAGVLTTHIAVRLSNTVIVPTATFVGTTHESPKILAGPSKIVVDVAETILTVQNAVDFIDKKK